MNEADIPIDIHTLKLQDWLHSRRLVQSTKSIPALKDIRTKISNALKDMPSNEQLIALLQGTNINYYYCREIVEILKQTEKDTKSVFGTYGSQRMKDWQEIIRLYEKDNTYLAEAAQNYVRNVNFEIPSVRKQMIKLEQQSDECLKRAEDLAKPEAQLLVEHAALLHQLGVKGNNLSEEFLQVLSKLPELYSNSIANICAIQEAIDLYSACSEKKVCLPILRHIVEFGNTTVYEYIHKEAPLSVEEPALRLSLSEGAGTVRVAGDEIDFGCDDNNGGTSSTVSAELIDFGDLNLETTGGDEGEIDWGIESSCGPTDNVEINFDISLEEYGIVVESAGMDGGTAKGEQAYTLLDAPSYRDRFLDELHELDAFLRLRLLELHHLDVSNNIMFSLLDSVSAHDAESIRKMVSHVECILQQTSNDQIHHLWQLKHSPKYADLLAAKLKQMTKAVEKIRANKETLKERAVELKQQRQQLNPVLADLITQARQLQKQIERDISKRYKNRTVNLLGGVN